MRQLSDTSLRIALIIVRKTYGWIADPETGMRKKEDWIAYYQIKQFSGRENAAVTRAIRDLEDLGLIDVRGQGGNSLSRDHRRGKKLFYRFKTVSESGDVVPDILQDVTAKRTSESGDTKETNTKTLSKDKGDINKSLGCPLKNGKLQHLYPKGHIECIEYVTSFKFVNKDKQFMFLHKLLRAGLDFPAIDKLISRIEKQDYYKENGYDFATIAKEADRRLNASP